MEEKKLVPKLRFPGFTEPWEQRKFGDLFEYERPDAYIVKSDNYNNDFNMPVLTANKAFILGYTNEENSYNKPSIIFDDFTLDRKYVDFPYMLKSSAIKILTSKNQHNLRFLFERLNSTRFEVLGHARHYISVVQNTTTLCPSVDEEVCISNLLTKFDELITLHQRKLEHLKLKKKSLLQKLFPKEGEVYPELRFPGFTDPWEQRKLGECMNSFAYGLNAAAKGYDGMHKYIRITDIDDETHNFIQSNLASPDIDFNMDVSHYKLNVGDIVFARTGASVGKTYLYNPNDGDLYYAGFLIRGKVKEDCDAGFIYQNTLTKDYDSFIKITSQRSGQPGVNSKEYATFRLNIPCKDEQEKISKVLNSLDELFTLHQRKLEHLQLLKKALLQQLFV